MLPSLATVDKVVTSLPSSVILRIVPTDTWWKQTYFNIFLLFEYQLRIKIISLFRHTLNFHSAAAGTNLHNISVCCYWKLKLCSSIGSIEYLQHFSALMIDIMNKYASSMFDKHGTATYISKYPLEFRHMFSFFI